MKLSDFYAKVLSFGIDQDPRKEKAKIKSFSDTAILHGDLTKDIRKVMVGIDIDVAELILADRIRSTKGLDLVISHHPQGFAFAGLYEVMQVQADILKSIGIAGSVAQGFLEERMREVQRKVMPANHMRVVDAARLLDMAFMCIHTPADNHVCQFIQQLITKHKPQKLSDILDVLNTVEEYQEATLQRAGPRIILGNPGRAAGKVFVEMTGGTEGPRDVYDTLYKAGIRTLVAMHVSEEHFKKVTEANLNVIVAGHISSDTLGLNLLLDRIEKEQKLSVVAVSGFRRIRRI